MEDVSEKPKAGPKSLITTETKNTGKPPETEKVEGTKTKTQSVDRVDPATDDLYQPILSNPKRPGFPSGGGTVRQAHTPRDLSKTGEVRSRGKVLPHKGSL